jgi:tetratricopeptide (TPR) repeat protein
VIVALVMAGQLFLAWRGRVFALGAVVFWAGLLPVANLVPLYRPMADRFLYVPMAGVAMIVAQGLAISGKWRPAACGIAGLWICWAAILTFQREAVWHNSLTLWQATAAENPYSNTAQNNLGWALLKADRNPEAAAAFRSALRLVLQKDADSWAGLALATDAAGFHAEADTDYRRAIGLDARYAHPGELVRALVTEPADAAKLEVLARRVHAPFSLHRTPPPSNQ